MNDNPIWTREQAVELLAEFEGYLKFIGYHVALGGSVLTQGQSFKDLDCFVYPHKTTETASHSVIFSTIGVQKAAKADHKLYGDDKDVWCADWEGKRIDFFFVK